MTLNRTNNYLCGVVLNETIFLKSLDKVNFCGHIKNNWIFLHIYDIIIEIKFFGG